MIKKNLLILALLSAGFSAGAQENAFLLPTQERTNIIGDSILLDTATIIGVVYEEDTRAAYLINSLAKFNVQGDFIIKDGYQIQISFSSERSKVEEQRLRFIRMYPSMESRIEYDAPNYTVKVGSFENIDDAEDFRAVITSTFPTCIIQRTRIKIPVSRN